MLRKVVFLNLLLCSTLSDSELEVKPKHVKGRIVKYVKVKNTPNIDNPHLMTHLTIDDRFEGNLPYTILTYNESQK